MKTKNEKEWINNDKWKEVINQIELGKRVKILRKRQRATAFISGKKYYYNGDQMRETLKVSSKSELMRAVSVFGNIYKNITKYLISVGLNVSEIETTSTGIFINHKVIENISENENIIHIDIDHAYWRIAYKLGYIDKKTYERYLDKKYKLLRNIGLASIISPIILEIYENGNLKLQITENRDIYNIIYKNIRHTCFNILEDIKKEIGVNNLVSYRIDGVIVKEGYEKKVIEILNKKDFSYKIEILKKIDNKHYINLNNNQVKMF